MSENTLSLDIFIFSDNRKVEAVTKNNVNVKMDYKLYK